MWWRAGWRQRCAVVAATAATLVGGSAPADAAEPAIEAGLLALVNEARAAHGVAPLEGDDAAADRARGVAVTLRDTTRLEHTPTAVLAGFYLPSSTLAAEAIGRTWDASSQALFDAWLASEHHRELLLGARFGCVGFGVVTADDGTAWAAAHLHDCPAPDHAEGAATDTGDAEGAPPAEGVAEHDDAGAGHAVPASTPGEDREVDDGPGPASPSGGGTEHDDGGPDGTGGTGGTDGVVPATGALSELAVHDRDGEGAAPARPARLLTSDGHGRQLQAVLQGAPVPARAEPEAAAPRPRPAMTASMSFLAAAPPQVAVLSVLALALVPAVRWFSPRRCRPGPRGAPSRSG